MSHYFGQPKYITIIAVVLLFILALYPLANLVVRSLPLDTQYLLNQRQCVLLKNGVLMAGGTALFSVLLGLPFALLISHTTLSFGGWLHYIYLAPLLIPPYMSALSWIHLLGKNSWLNKFIMEIFSLNTPLFTIYTIWGAIWILTLSYFPFVTLLSLSGLKSIEVQLEEAASLTHGRGGIIRGITLPLIIPFIFSGAIFVFVFSFINYSVPALLEIPTYPIEIFAQFSSYYNERAAMAFTVPLILLTISLIFFQKYYMGQRSYICLTGKKKEEWELKNWQFPATVFILGILFLSVFVPVADLVITAGTFHSYVKAFQTSYKQIGFTLLWALLASTIMMIMGFFISYYIERADSAKADFIDTLSIMLFAVPGTVMGIGLIHVWNKPATDFIYCSGIIILIAYIARYIPFMTTSIRASLRQIDKRLEEAGTLTHQGWFTRIRSIVLPLAAPGLCAGWLITFVLCIGELDATLLVMPPGKATIAIRIYTLMHYGANKLVAALCVILLLLCALPPVIVLLLNKYHGKIRNAYDA
ncbi:MAG: ABC transporter permease [bacterium]